MELTEALRQIPDAYSAVLSLAEQDLEEAEIAVLLGVPPESVAPLLRVARAKLARLIEGTSELLHEPAIHKSQEGTNES